MAGPKKTRRTKDTGSPNVVLVIFLVVFVLSSILLGLLLYFSYQDRDIARAAAFTKEKEKTAAQTAAEMYRYTADNLSNALGRKLDGDELAGVKQGHEKLLDANSPYAALKEKNYGTYVELIKTLDKDLGYDNGQYPTTYDAKYREKADEAEKSQAELKKAQADLASVQRQFNDLRDRQEKFYADMVSRFDKEQKVTLRDANKVSDEMTKLIQTNTALNQQIVELEQQRTKIEKTYQKQIKTLEENLESKDKDRAEGNLRGDAREPHALLLDVSTGKPLWDQPVGTITRVDTKNKEVTINLGSAKGVRPDLTFTVFAPGKYVATRADKQMKGTIEVVRVLGPNAALARITSQYDPAEFPIHEGDLLFNLFWGTHVAVAGYPSVTGLPSESPSEQQRKLNDFLALLSRQGIQVDAYLDLTDGQVKGAITPQTRFLILGDRLQVNTKDLEKAKDGDKEGGKAQEAGVLAERAVAVTNGMLAMNKEATEKGLFVISARNFATVIGYRPTNTRDQVMTFRPQLPSAANTPPGLSGGVGSIGAAREAPMPPAEQKEKTDAKDKDKN
jgi:hypothetical protein